MNLYPWAARHGVSVAALKDLERELGLEGIGTMRPDDGRSEAAVQARVRLEASAKGVRLFRNNSGVLPNAAGTPVRFGLGNESAPLNKILKSPDLVGWRRRVITPDMVGHVIGQAVLREVKEADWQYRGDDHELAQQRFLMLALLDGCDAGFCQGEGTL